MFEELELKFTNIQNKIELKKHTINDSFQRDIKAVNESFNEKSLEQKYSTELNLYRDGLLKQISTNMRSEIDQVGWEHKQFKKNIEFKRGSVKSAKISVGRLIKKEFKLSKIFSIGQLIKYKNYLGLEQVIGTDDESNDKNVLNKAMHLASENGRIEIVKYLVENGADVDAKDKEYNTALIWASQKGSF